MNNSLFIARAYRKVFSPAMTKEVHQFLASFNRFSEIAFPNFDLILSEATKICLSVVLPDRLVHDGSPCTNSTRCT